MFDAKFAEVLSSSGLSAQADGLGTTLEASVVASTNFGEAIDQDHHQDDNHDHHHTTTTTFARVFALHVTSVPVAVISTSSISLTAAATVLKVDVSRMKLLGAFEGSLVLLFSVDDQIYSTNDVQTLWDAAIDR